MLSRTDELEAFKCRINLCQYAASCGYVLDRKASSRSSVVMSNGAGDKIVVAIGHDGHWMYFSVRDDGDHGSIIDFVQRRSGGSLGEVRKRLHPFLDGSHSPALPDARAFSTPLHPASKDSLRVRARFESMTDIQGAHAYLENVRRIPAEVLKHPRFAGRIHADSYGNAVFPHWNLSGLSGFEIKNRNFTGFAPGGEKGLWVSRSEDSDAALVIAESGIDALSHFALRRPSATRYASTAGALNSNQPALIRQAVEKLPAGASVILATDNDPGGDALARTIREFLAQSPQRFLIVEDRPAERGQDWNDVLCADGLQKGQ